MSTNPRYFEIEFLIPENNPDPKATSDAKNVRTTGQKGYQKIEDQVQVGKDILDNVCTGIYLSDGTLLSPTIVHEYRLTRGMTEVIPAFIVPKVS